MIFNKHLELEGKHAVLSASQNAWLRYPEGKLEQVYTNNKIKEKGTEFHNLAKDLIRLKVHLPNKKQALHMFVNDAINFRMQPEQPLFYSKYAFGTADAICYRRNILRIHDLKTGEDEVKKLTQLEIYAAYFCLEYSISPFDIKEIVLRIYQFDRIFEEIAKPEDIKEIMDRIITDSEKLYKVDQILEE